MISSTSTGEGCGLGADLFGDHGEGPSGVEIVETEDVGLEVEGVEGLDVIGGEVTVEVRGFGKAAEGKAAGAPMGAEGVHHFGAPFPGEEVGGLERVGFGLADEGVGGVAAAALRPGELFHVGDGVIGAMPHPVSVLEEEAETAIRGADGGPGFDAGEAPEEAEDIRVLHDGKVGEPGEVLPGDGDGDPDAGAAFDDADAALGQGRPGGLRDLAVLSGAVGAVGHVEGGDAGSGEGVAPLLVEFESLFPLEDVARHAGEGGRRVGSTLVKVGAGHDDHLGFQEGDQIGEQLARVRHGWYTPAEPT